MASRWLTKAMTTRRILKPTKNATYRAGQTVTVDYKSGMAIVATIVNWTRTELVCTFNGKTRTIPAADILFVSVEA
jgi:hypothetical protein